MITFARGLVLREGVRSMEFERQLEFGKVQFKYLDNFEIRTFSLGGLYCKILAKTIQVVHQNGNKVGLPDQVNMGGGEHVYSLDINKRQEDLIEYRLRFVRAAVRMQATPSSRRKLTEVINGVAVREGDPPQPTRVRQLINPNRHKAQ